jgi:uncharacterized membrane protein YgdD (TMEM256/DUF423 family)
MSTHKYLRAIAIFGAIAVIVGAFGAHALKDSLAKVGHLETYKTGSFYHFVHTCVLLGIYIMIKIDDHKVWRQSFMLMCLGIVMFSGSLYILSTRHMIGGDFWKFVGPITPIGGLFLVAGWLNMLRR